MVFLMLSHGTGLSNDTFQIQAMIRISFPNDIGEKLGWCEDETC